MVDVMLLELDPLDTKPPTLEMQPSNVVLGGYKQSKTWLPILRIHGKVDVSKGGSDAGQE
jgi:hypothetical protein